MRRLLLPALGVMGFFALCTSVVAAPAVELGAELTGLMTVANTRDPRARNQGEASEYLLSRHASAQDERLDTHAPRLLLVPVGESQEAGVGLAVRYRF